MTKYSHSSSKRKKEFVVDDNVYRGFTKMPLFAYTWARQQQ